MTPNATLHFAAQAAWALSVLISGCASDLPPDPNQGAPQAPLSAVTSPEPQADHCDRPPAGATLLDLELHGHAEEILLSDDRVLAAGDFGWALWEKATARLIANGAVQHGVDLVGDTLLTNGPDVFTLWNARDGAKRLEVATPNPLRGARLSHDGSYVFMPLLDGLGAWDLTGRKLLSRRIAFPEGGIFAAPGELRIVRSDVKRIETIAIDSGHVRATAPYEGSFGGWFVDGAHFITVPRDRKSNDLDVRVYTKDAALMQSIRWPGSEPDWWEVGGEAGYFWLTQIENGRDLTSLYRLGQADPFQVLDFHFVRRPPRSMMAMLTHHRDSTFQLLDLRRPAVTLTEKVLPEYTNVVATDAEGHWFYGSRGVVIDGSRGTSREQRREFGCGTVWAIKGGGERLAVATHHGITRLYSFREGRPKLIWKHSGIDVGGLAFMGEGRYLVVRGPEDGAASSDRCAVHIYEFDEEDRLVRERHPVSASRSCGPLEVATSGTRYTHTQCDGAGLDMVCERKVMDLDGPLPWRFGNSESEVAPATLSPSGALLAVRTATGTPKETLTIYREGVLQHELTATAPILWLSDDRLLVGADGGRQKIVDLNGAVITELATPLEGTPERHGTGVFHDEKSVYRVRDGKLLWRAGSPPTPWTPRATVGSRFVYVNDHAVRVESFARRR